MTWRSPIVLAVVALVALLLIGGGAYYIGRSSNQATSPTATVTPPPARATSTAQPSATSTPSSPSPSSPEPQRAVQWVEEATVRPGQPTPTAPPGVFFFKSAAGKMVANAQPSASPAPMMAKTYADARDHYTIHYPSGWMQQTASRQGHQIRTYYPPGTNPNAQAPGGAPGISVGWTATVPSIGPHDSAYTDMGSVLASGVHGRLFTIGGPMGYVVTAAFPHAGGYVVVSADADSDVLLATFRQMLASLKFT